MDKVESPLRAARHAVRASAGTGKTWLLTQRIVRLLLEGAEPGSILAITFTQKAAKEIEARVSAQLRELAQADSATLHAALRTLELPVTAATCVRAQTLYEDYLAAAIHPLRATTFHAFCHELLRRFPYEAGVIPGFELIERTGVLERSARANLERDARHDAALAAHLDTLLQACAGLGGALAALDDFLTHRADWWAYAEGADPQAQALARLRQALDLDPHTDPLAIFAEPGMRARLQRYCALLDRHRLDTHTQQQQKLSLACADTTPPGKCLELVATVLLTQSGSPRAVSALLLKKLSASEADEFERLRLELIDTIASIRRWQRHKFTYDVSAAWYVCGTRLLEHYQAAKAALNVLDFADLEWKAYLLLNRSEHAQWIQYKLDRRIDHLLIDEFQDTNPTQWRLLLPLLEELAAGAETPRSIFFVGDEKQSIYRFRRAQPELFSTAIDWLTARADAGVSAQKVSYRSSPAIIDFVNHVFADAGDDAIGLPSFVRHDTHLRTRAGAVEVLPIITAAESEISVSTIRDPLRAPRVTAEDSRYAQEGERLAQTILQCVGRYNVGDPARPLAYGDVLVLMRERTHAAHYEHALRRHGIPFVGNARGSLGDYIEVQDILQLLRCLINPHDDLALATVLKSPLFGANDIELMQLAVAARTRANWQQALIALDAAPPPLSRARALLFRWREHVDTVPVHDLLDRIYHDGNVVARYQSAAPAHLQSQVRANLMGVLSAALDLDSGRYPSVARFISEFDMASTTATVAASDCVRLLTIHAAKGLEAPVVFLVDAARTPRQTRGMRAIVEWPANAPRPSHFHLIGNRDNVDDMSRVLLALQQQAAAQEEMNLLYVALTRAQQFLFVSACAPRRGDRFWYGAIERRLRAGVPDSNIVSTISVNEVEDNCYGAFRFGEPTLTTPAIPSEDTGPVDCDPRLVTPIAASIDEGFVYPSTAEADDERDSSHTGRQRGIAIHRLLQLLSEGMSSEQAIASVAAQHALTHAQLQPWLEEAKAVLGHPDLRALFDRECYVQARNEIAILYRDGARDVFGVIDRAVFTADTLTLIDYKTNADISPPNQAELQRRYANQLRLYARGAQRLWPKLKVRALLIFTANCALAEVTL